jgi:DNA-binding NtrC family response regulator
MQIIMAAMQERTKVASEVAKRLNMTPTTLYYYLNGDGTLKEPGYKLINPC